MDVSDATRIVFARILSLEPENVSKIMGYLLLQDNGDQEIIRLALGSEALLQSLISKAKKDLGLVIPTAYSSYLPLHISQVNNSSPSRPAFPSPSLVSPNRPSVYWGGSSHLQQQQERSLSFSLPTLSLQPHDQPRMEDHNNVYINYRPNSLPLHISSNEKLQQPPPAAISYEKLPNYSHDQLTLRDDYQLRDQLSFFNDSLNPHNMFPAIDYLFPDQMVGYVNGNKLGIDHLNSIATVNGDCNLNLSPSTITTDHVSESSPAPSWKPCMYFARGYCKHGSNCRFLHGYTRQENALPLSLSGSPTGSRNSDEAFQVGSLERLEFELQELLRGKRAPVSIASLPQLYYEKYGKTLQAEGYLTESQRHGKAGYSLTKLLARLKNTVTLIDSFCRPHGQHALVLAEDAHKFMSYKSGVDDLGGVNSGSRQIYLTFPAESTFTEEDVSNYFRTYGPVHDVRIPYQQKRMFGFVTFTYPDTVKVVLAKGNPHYVCGARVLVKPYREKGKLGDRKNPDRSEQYTKYAPFNNFDAKDYDHMHLATLNVLSGPRVIDNSDAIRKHIEEQDQAIEFERKRLAELHFADAQRAYLAAENHFSFAASTPALVSQGIENRYTNGFAQSEEESKASEDLNNFPSTDHFGYLLEVLENNEDESKHEDNDDQESYGHNLPESPFSNLNGSNGSKTSLYTLEKTVGNMPTIPRALAQASSASVIKKELTCSICLDAVVEPKQLACSHFFCLKCVPKVIRMSNIEECPICTAQHKGNTVFKLSERRDLQYDYYSGKGAIPTPTPNVW